MDAIELRDISPDDNTAKHALLIYGQPRAILMKQHGMVTVNWQVYGPQAWTQARLLIRGLLELMVVADNLLGDRPAMGKSTGSKVYYYQGEILVLEVSRTKTDVSFIKLALGDGLEVTTLPIVLFNEHYKATEGYPAERAAQVLVNYAESLGASKEAMEHLNKFTKIDQEVMKMATKRKVDNEVEEAKPKKAPAKKAVAKKDKVASKSQGEEKSDQAPPATKKKSSSKVKVVRELGKVITVEEQAAPSKSLHGNVKVVKVAKDPAPAKSASALFQELIMDGKLTDDEIFEEVKRQFGLDDSKKGYVKWYRAHMRKKGIKVPNEVKA